MFRLTHTFWDSDTKAERAQALPASSSKRKRLEVRREAAQGSGAKAARRDLESDQPLGERSHYQAGLQAAHEEAAQNRIETAVAHIAEVDEELADNEREQEWRADDIDAAGERLDEAIDERDKIPTPRRFLATISNTTYLVIMALFAGAEYPLLRLSLVRLPVDDATIKTIAILMGATLVAGVHVLALATSRLVQPEGDRTESRRDWFTHLTVVATGAFSYVLVILGLAWVRAGEMNGIDKAFTGHGLSHPGWLGIALGFLHAATLLAAFYVAYHRARGAEWRAAQQLVEKRQEQKNDAEDALEELDRREGRLHVRRQSIIDRADRDLERLLRHHVREESDYLAILARSLDNPPKPIDNWDTSRTPFERHVPTPRTLEKAIRSNGKPDSRTTERIRRSVHKP